MLLPDGIPSGIPSGSPSAISSGILSGQPRLTGPYRTPGTTSPEIGSPSPATARETSQAISTAPRSWKWVLSWTPFGKFGYCPAASHRKIPLDPSIPTPSR